MKELEGMKTKLIDHLGRQ